MTLNWQPAKIEIRRVPGGTASVDADVCGPLAIHAEEETETTSLTHVPTGTYLVYAVGCGTKARELMEEAAERFARVLPLDDPRWQADGSDKDKCLWLRQLWRDAGLMLTEEPE